MLWSGYFMMPNPVFWFWEYWPSYCAPFLYEYFPWPLRFPFSKDPSKVSPFGYCADPNPYGMYPSTNFPDQIKSWHQQSRPFRRINRYNVVVYILMELCDVTSVWYRALKCVQYKLIVLYILVRMKRRPSYLHNICNKVSTSWLRQ